MKKTIFLVMMLTVISKVIGFMRDIILAYFYGASPISDVFLISLVIPSVIFSFIGTSIYTGYIPMYTHIEGKYGVKEAEKFTNNLISVVLLFSALIFVGCMLFTEPIVQIFAYGFQGATLSLAVTFTKITLASMFFSGIVFIFSGYLQNKGNHWAPSLIGLPLNLSLIIAIILSSMTHIYFLPIGKVLAAGLQLLFLSLFVYKSGYIYKIVLDFKDQHIRKMGLLAIPVILGSSVEQINKLIDRTIASNIAIGGISALTYANQLVLFVQGIFVTSIAMVFYPVITRMAAKNDIQDLKNTLSQLIVLINAILIPATVGLMIFSEPIIFTLFGRGAFSNQAISMTSTALLFYSFGLIGYGVREILNKAFYSIQDTRTPMMNAVIAMVINIILNIILSRFMGVGGLALATSISGLICSILLFISLSKKIGTFKLRAIVLSSVKVSFVSIVMGIGANIVYQRLIENFNLNVSLFISVIVGVLLYAILISFMKIKEIDEFVLGLKKKLGRA